MDAARGGGSGTVRGDGQRWARRAEGKTGLRAGRAALDAARGGGTLCAAAPPLRSAPTARGGRERRSCAVGEQAQRLRRAERGPDNAARRGKRNGARGWVALGTARGGENGTARGAGGCERDAERGNALCGGPPVKVSPHGARGKGAALPRRRGTGSAPAAGREGNRTTRRAEGEVGLRAGMGSVGRGVRGAGMALCGGNPAAAPSDGGRGGLRGRVD